jgi:UDP-glucose 4-epimerase
MRIAITGGNGRIGRATVDLALAQGHSVVNIDRITGASEDSRVTHIQIDTADYESFLGALEGCDALIHLAAIAAPDLHPDHTVHNNNVVSSYNALRAAAEHGVLRVCQASSINAIGGVYSRRPQYDYFPVDEQHPTYNEDPYSLSKWICELQADSFARRYENMTIASLRIHGVVPERIAITSSNEVAAKHLWGYTRLDATAQACLLGLTADFNGHETFYIVAPDTVMNVPSTELKDRYYPDVPLRGELNANQGFFDCQKARRLLGWQHDTA